MVAAGATEGIGGCWLRRRRGLWFWLQVCFRDCFRFGCRSWLRLLHGLWCWCWLRFWLRLWLRFWFGLSDGLGLCFRLCFWLCSWLLRCLLHGLEAGQFDFQELQLEPGLLVRVGGGGEGFTQARLTLLGGPLFQFALVGVQPFLAPALGFLAFGFGRGLLGLGGAAFAVGQFRGSRRRGLGGLRGSLLLGAAGRGLAASEHVEHLPAVLGLGLLSGLPRRPCLLLETPADGGQPGLGSLRLRARQERGAGLQCGPGPERRRAQR